MSAPVKGTKPYLIVCQAEGGDHEHVDADTLEEAQAEARSCFYGDCDCQPVIYERASEATPVPVPLVNEVAEAAAKAMNRLREALFGLLVFARGNPVVLAKIHGALDGRVEEGGES